MVPEFTGQLRRDGVRRSVVHPFILTGARLNDLASPCLVNTPRSAASELRLKGWLEEACRASHADERSDVTKLRPRVGGGRSYTW